MLSFFPRGVLDEILNLSQFLRFILHIIAFRYIKVTVYVIKVLFMHIIEQWLILKPVFG